MTAQYYVDAPMLNAALLNFKIVNDNTNTVRFQVDDSRSSFRVVKTENGHYMTLEVKRGRSEEGINVDAVWFENEATQKAYLDAKAAIEESNKGLDAIFGKA